MSGELEWCCIERDLERNALFFEMLGLEDVLLMLLVLKVSPALATDFRLVEEGCSLAWLILCAPDGLLKSFARFIEGLEVTPFGR